MIYETKFDTLFAPITAERVTIRRFTPADGADLAEILTDPEVVRFEPYSVFTPEQAAAEAEKFAESDCFYAVELNAEKKVIGKLYFHEEGNFGTYELGYTFAAAYQGMGYAKESAAALIEAAFAGGAVRRITAFVDGANTHSWNLLEHLGFVREGEMRAYTYKFTDEDGEPIWQDMLCYALLESDWARRNADEEETYD